MSDEGLPGRDQALALLHEYTTGAGLRKHAYGCNAEFLSNALGMRPNVTGKTLGVLPGWLVHSCRRSSASL